MTARWIRFILLAVPLLLADSVFAQSQLKADLRVSDPEVEFGRPFILEFELTRSADLDVEPWADDRFAPLVLKRLDSTEESRGGVLVEKHRYEARLFRRGAATIRPAPWRGFPLEGGEVVVAECSPLLLFVKSSLDLQDPGPIETIDELEAEPRMWAFARGPLVFWAGLSVLMAVGLWLCFFGLRRSRRPIDLTPLERGRAGIREHRAAGEPASPFGVDLLRDYLLAEFRLAAPLMTTGESLAILGEDARFDPGLVERLKRLFETSDARKFEGPSGGADEVEWSEIEATLEDLNAIVEANSTAEGAA